MRPSTAIGIGVGIELDVVRAAALLIRYHLSDGGSLCCMAVLHLQHFQGILCPGPYLGLLIGCLAYPVLRFLD